jgi:hypothetical protein
MPPNKLSQALSIIVRFNPVLSDNAIDQIAARARNACK